MKQSGEVIIVGGGLAGLACATGLHRGGREFLILEASDELGGRVRTDEEQGFLLDRGFQVFLSAYPEAGKLLDLDALDLKPFRPGALILKDGKLHRLMDVFRCPQHALATALQPIGTLKDKLLVGNLRLRAMRRSTAANSAGEDCTTEDYLRRYGFSEAMIDGFFRAFYGGIFLERDLRTSSRMFEFTFQMFARGFATLPAKGMQEIPRQLTARLPRKAIRINAPVQSVGCRGVTLADGEQLRANTVVIATDGDSAPRLLPGSVERQTQWRSVIGIYFSAPESPLNEAIIALNGESDGLVNNVCVLSDVAPSYAPHQRALISVSVLGLPENPHLEDEVLAELRGWFGAQVERWEHLRTDRIRRALPEQPPSEGSNLEQAYRIHDGVLICGDHCTSASIEGALVSGLRTAEAILASPNG